MKALTFVLLACAVVLTFSTSANGTLLNLTPQPPNIASNSLDISYYHTTDSLVIGGLASTLDDDGDGDPEAIVAGLYNITVSVDADGVLLGGTLTVGGTVPTLGYNSGIILAGDLTAFGFSPSGGEPLEFLFMVAGGDAAGLYGLDSVGGIIVDGSSSNDFSGTFISDWSNNFGIPGVDTGDAFADTFLIPEPATLGLMAFGLGLIARKRRS